MCFCKILPKVSRAYAPPPQAAWFLKGRALTEQTYVDEVEMEEEGIAELFMDDNVVADVARKSTGHSCNSMASSHVVRQAVYCSGA